jgi:hypothetical protein
MNAKAVLCNVAYMGDAPGGGLVLKDMLDVNQCQV